MIQRQFAMRAKDILEKDENVIGLAVAGSWLTGELDAFSDLDLVLVTRDKVASDQARMLAYAQCLGHLLSGFTGEHVGEPRLLICLYDDPLLHVDIKFLTVDEFHSRIETPVILFDRDGLLQKALDHSAAQFPYPDHQWIEDRFWIWIHYGLLKIGRGEYLEAFDFLGYLRMVVLGPLLHIKNHSLPRGVRKVEMTLPQEDLQHLLQTVPTYDRQGLIDSFRKAVMLYRELRQALFDPTVLLQQETERKVMLYFDDIEYNPT